MTQTSNLTITNKQTVATLVKSVGLLLGPLVAIIFLFNLPDHFAVQGKQVEFTAAGRATLAVMTWMSIWWLTECVHVTVTALLPLALFPILQIADINQTAEPYAHRLIFLYMGGFFLAMAMDHWGLGKRIALMTINFVGTKPHRIIAGFMLTTAVLSAFVSNTATAVMMVAIAGNLTKLVNVQHKESKFPAGNFAICLMLGIAYAASIGGMATIIGTPPNSFLVGFLRDGIAEPYRTDISFIKWMMLGVPVALLLLPLAYLALINLFRFEASEIQGGKQLIQQELRSLGRLKYSEWVVLSLFSLTVALWLSRSGLQAVEFTWNDLTYQPFVFVTDEAIVMLTSFFLFVIPCRQPGQRFVLEWQTAQNLPWGILILFGGGLSLAAAVKENGVAEFIGSQTAFLANVPFWVVLLVVVIGIVFLTELTSNVATTASLVPVLAAMAPSLNLHPYLLIFPATFAASCAFMLPVATPPNAIVFGTGQIQLSNMIRAGLVINGISVVVLFFSTLIWLRYALGV